MKDASIDRKEFLANFGICCAASCVGALAMMLDRAHAQDGPAKAPQAALPVPEKASPSPAPLPGAQSQPGIQTQSESQGPAQNPRAVARVEFADGWLVRFFHVLDTTLDKETRKKIMMANGKACLLAWQQKTGATPGRVTLERFAAWARDNVKDGSIRVEGNTIHFQYTSAAETGLPSSEGSCLCPLAESKPAGLSATYCLCSVGYVKEMHEQRLGRPCEVELVDSVLMGGKRCRFRIRVA